jgi:hypothetical protein
VTGRPAQSPQEAAPSAARPFIEAVLTQLFGPAGAYRDAPEAERNQVAASLSHVLAADADGIHRDAVARQLLRHAPLASAIFQNIDLLYAHRFTGADGVARLMMHLLELEGDASERALDGKG